MAKKIFYKIFFFKKIFFCKGYFYKKKFFYLLFIRVNHDGYNQTCFILFTLLVVCLPSTLRGTKRHKDSRLNKIKIFDYERSLTFRRAPNVALYNPRGKLSKVLHLR